MSNPYWHVKKTLHFSLLQLL